MRAAQPLDLRYSKCCAVRAIVPRWNTEHGTEVQGRLGPRIAHNTANAHDGAQRWCGPDHGPRGHGPAAQGVNTGRHWHQAFLGHDTRVRGGGGGCAQRARGLACLEAQASHALRQVSHSLRQASHTLRQVSHALRLLVMGRRMGGTGGLGQACGVPPRAYGR